jgi:hypothetical protein
MSKRKTAPRALPRLGKQPPRYRFFLNPYTDVRVTRCPQCAGKTRVRKLPLVIHIEPQQLIALNKTCRYCPYCDLLIAHQDEIETWLAAFFGQTHPELVGNDSLIVGAEDRADWQRGVRDSLAIPDALACLHDVADVVQFTPAPRCGPA